MKEYLRNLKQKTPHEQRGHASRVAGALTVVIFFVWLTATGVRLSLHVGEPTPSVASDTQSQNPDTGGEGQLANVVSAVSGGSSGAANTAASGNTLVVATTSLVNSH